MSDPRFFRRYLDILGEQPLPASTNQATVNIGNNTTFTADKNTSTVSGTTKVDPNTTVSATKDVSPGGASTVGVKTNVNGVDLSAQKNSPAYNKGQLAGTSSVSAAYKDTTGALGTPGQTHTVNATKGVAFGGASGPNVGKNVITTYTKT